MEGRHAFHDRKASSRLLRPHAGDSKREGVVLRDHGLDVAAVVSVADAEMIRRAKALAAVKVRDELATDAQEKGLTEQILNEILNERP